MKITIEPLEKAYDACTADGLFRDQSKINVELIKSLLSQSEVGIERLNMIGLSFEKKTENYSFVLRDNYEILRMLIDALLYFDKVSISNHQCGNAYLCMKYPELEFDWEILETMRLLRNAVNYEGISVSPEQWSKLNLQFKVYIPSLQKMIKTKLKEL